MTKLAGYRHAFIASARSPSRDDRGRNAVAFAGEQHGGGGAQRPGGKHSPPHHREAASERRDDVEPALRYRLRYQRTFVPTAAAVARTDQYDESNTPMAVGDGVNADMPKAPGDRAQVSSPGALEISM